LKTLTSSPPDIKRVRLVNKGLVKSGSVLNIPDIENERS